MLFDMVMGTVSVEPLRVGVPLSDRVRPGLFDSDIEKLPILEAALPALSLALTAIACAPFTSPVAGQLTVLEVAVQPASAAASRWTVTEAEWVPLEASER